ncbi:hypothetical protein [Streptomyces sp. NPDC001787]|uniref:hypothetical protein n=1 Tax=Streptomyces sp. NPDC001787 TaxID=3154523 RepID=UPI00331F0668
MMPLTRPAAAPLPAGVTDPEDIRGAVDHALRRFWDGRETVLLLDDFDHRATALVAELRTCGAHVAAVVTRAGPGPGAPEVEEGWHCTDAGMELTRPQFESWLRRPGADVRRWLDSLDPHRRWLALGTTRTGVARFCGRPVHGWRRPSWADVEDKTTIDRLWARIGVASPPYTVLSVADALRDPGAAGRLGGPAGVVVAADSSQGHVGDALGVRWVPRTRRFEDAVRELGAASRRVRVARFADGVPCSVLAMALPGSLAVFSPIEIVTLGDPVAGRLLFSGSSTHWRPGGAAERGIREAARRAGAELVRTAGYRGLFSVDGLLTEEGFTATELNSRHASGLGLRAGVPDFPLYLFNRAVQEGVPGLEGIRGVALERFVRDAVAAVPSYALSVPVAGPGHRDGPARLTDGSSRVDYHVADGAAVPTAIAPPMADHRAGPACALLAARLGDPALRSFPLGSTP